MVPETLEKWHELISSGRLDDLGELLADEVTFHSPVVHTPQQGRQITSLYLTAAYKVLGNDSFRYIREVTSGNNAVLEFETELDGIHLNGVDMITWNDDGKIIDFKVMVRPLKAINKVHELMGAMLKSL